MGFCEAAVLIHSANGFDKDSLLRVLSKKTRIEKKFGGAIYLPDWYRLPEDERAAFLISHQSPIYIVLHENGEFVDVSTDDDLFWPPVRRETSDVAIRQYAELVQLLGTYVNADMALQYPLGSSAGYLTPMREWLKGHDEIFAPTMTAYAIFGCKTTGGFRTFIQRQPAANPAE